LAHAVPHPPQFNGSLVGSEHVVPTPIPPLQVVPAQLHVALAHVSPWLQMLAQLPQAVGSVLVSTQTPPQVVLPAGQTHCAAMQL
jgi:hypothetical protein